MLGVRTQHPEAFGRKIKNNFCHICLRFLNLSIIFYYFIKSEREYTKKRERGRWRGLAQPPPGEDEGQAGEDEAGPGEDVADFGVEAAAGHQGQVQGVGVGDVDFRLPEDLAPGVDEGGDAGIGGPGQADVVLHARMTAMARCW